MKEYKMNYNAKAVDSFKTKWSLFCFHQLVNKTENFTLESFKTFEIEEELLQIYTTQYHQYEDNEYLDESGLHVGKLRKEMKAILEHESKASLQAYYVSNFKKVFPRKDFDKLGKDTKCFYCELDRKGFDELYEKLLIKKKANRGFNLELDRKTPNLEYTPENCVMACYWCNNAKTDEFDAEEFKPIGLAIREQLKKRSLKFNNSVMT